MKTERKVRQLSEEDSGHYFLRVWNDVSPETYEAVWYEGIMPDEMIDELATHFSHLYRKLLDTAIERAWKEGLVL